MKDKQSIDWIKKLDNFIDKGGDKVIAEAGKTIKVIRIWVPIAISAFIIFLAGVLYFLFRFFTR